MKRAGSEHQTVLNKAACISVHNGRNQEWRFLCKAHEHPVYLVIHPMMFDPLTGWIGCSMQVMQTSRTISGPE
jgi:hypothetical protein